MAAETNSHLTELFPRRTDAVDLAAAYAFPEGATPWLRAVFVASADGAATLGGRSGGLGNATDRQLFALGRALADVVLVGAGTVRVEGYGPAEESSEWRFLREGRPPTPAIAVVSRSLNLDLSAPLFSAAPEHARTMVLTTGAAPRERLQAANKIADVIVAGDSTVNLTTAITELGERGYHRISCEGGPRLLANLVTADCLDELCLTCSPVIVSGDAIRITNGPRLDVPFNMRLVQVLTNESYLFVRYLRA
ncbi:MAG: pyrimidine reductase family protein [Acidimicrobiales bacterium]